MKFNVRRNEEKFFRGNRDKRFVWQTERKFYAIDLKYHLNTLLTFFQE